MQQIVVEIVHLQLLQRIMIHFLGLIRCPVVAIKIGEFRGNEVFAALMAAEGDARTTLRLTLTIHGRRIEIVHAMFDGIVNLLVDHILIELIAIVHLRRQPHHAITQNRHFLLCLGVLAIGHLAYGRLHLVLIFLCCLTPGFIATLATCQRSSCCYCSCSNIFQERSARYILLFHNTSSLIRFYDAPRDPQHILPRRDATDKHTHRHHNRCRQPR